MVLAANLELPLRQLPANGLPAQVVADAAAALKAKDPYNEPGVGLKKWGGIYHPTGREGEGGSHRRDERAYVLHVHMHT